MHDPRQSARIPATSRGLGALWIATLDQRRRVLSLRSLNRLLNPRARRPSLRISASGRRQMLRITTCRAWESVISGATGPGFSLDSGPRPREPTVPRGGGTVKRGRPRMSRRWWPRTFVIRRCWRFSTPRESGSVNSCGLDLDDVDRERRTIRVLGKGGRERVVPLGLPALDAIDAWSCTRAAQPRLRSLRAGGVPRGEGRADRPERGAAGRSRPAGRSGGAGHGAAWPPPHGGHPSAGGWGRSPERPGVARTRVAGHHPDLHARLDRTSQSRLPAGPSSSLIGLRAFPPGCQRLLRES